MTPCDFNIIDQHPVTDNANDTNIPHQNNLAFTCNESTHTETLLENQIQYHNFDNQDLLTFTDKYTALLQQELQNPYWNLHDPIVMHNFTMNRSVTPFIIWQPICRPHLLERVYKPMHTPH